MNFSELVADIDSILAIFISMIYLLTYFLKKHQVLNSENPS
jgi:hypothetical protein